jgi:hypothetical protein
VKTSLRVEDELKTLLLILLLVGCTKNWQPKIDPTGDEYVKSIDSDLRDCKIVAINAAAPGNTAFAYTGMNSEARYKRAYSNCTEKLGHKVIP